MPVRKKSVDIQREHYTMAAKGGESAEITMYGDIVRERPTDWWTGEPCKGSFIVLSEFLDDLEKISGVKNLTIRINSCGGDAYAAIPIHNRLRELKAHKTAIVDGVAYSGGSMIMCAADVVRVNPSSLVMIHMCSTLLCGVYNADELRKRASFNDTIDRAQVEIYSRRMDMEDDDILAFMKESLYMTGAEAIEKGLADELTEDEAVQIAASADRTMLFVNGIPRCLPFPLTNLPESIPTVNPEASNAASVVTNITIEGGNEPMDEMALKEATATAVADERNRLAAIDEIAHLFDEESVHAAKYGDNPCTAQEMTYAAAQKAAKNGQAFMRELGADADESHANGVGALPSAEERKPESGAPKSMEEARAHLAALTGARKEVDKV